MRGFRSRAFLILSAAMIVPACGGGSSGDSSTFTVAGTARYEKRGVDAATATLTAATVTVIPNALVEIVHKDTGNVVATGQTDSAGAFSVNVSAIYQAAVLFLRVLAAENVGHADFQVTNHSDVVHTASSPDFTGAQGALPLVASSDAAAGNPAGPFNVYAQVLRAMDFIRAVDPEATFPALRSHWAQGDSTDCTCESHAHAGGSVTFEIGFIDSAADTDVFDDSVIIHEFGHYVEEVFAHPSSPAGPHFSCNASTPQDLDYRLSFGEGWANAFAQMVLGSPVYVDTMTGGGLTAQMEIPCLTIPGPGSEDAVGGVFWDLYDGTTSGIASTDGDPIDLGFGPIWAAMKALRPVPHVYIDDLLTALLAAGAITQAQWDAAFVGLGMGSPLPAFPAAAIGTNASVPGTVNASLGQRSLFAASKYYALVIPTAGTLRVTLTIADSAANDLDLFLWEDPSPAHPPGERLATSEGFGAVETFTLAVSAGTYMIQVRAYDDPVGAAAAAFTLDTSF